MPLEVLDDGEPTQAWVLADADGSTIMLDDRHKG